MSEPKPTYLTRSASAPPPKENDMDFKIAPRTETTFKASAEAVTISQRGPQGAAVSASPASTPTGKR